MKNSGHRNVTTASDLIKAIAASSGGLDSILAAVLVARLGIDVTLLHVQHLFSATEEGRQRIRAAAKQVGLAVRVVDVSAEHLEVVRHPKHGYGVGMNPCVDCRVFLLRVAKRVMEEEGAQFVVTGEVLGQRPKSQHYDALMQVADESGLADRLLRPLSANLLPETLPVRNGWIRPEDLLSIRGRGRQQQIKLAGEFGITEYPQPAGGCLLVEKTYAARVRDAFEHEDRDNVGVEQFELLRYGRHFRLSDRTKVVVGRSQAENETVARYADGRLRIEPIDVPGPTTLVEGEPTDHELHLSAALAARYCDHQGHETIRMEMTGSGPKRIFEVRPLASEDPRIDAWRIG
jgi:tRNA-specific 2-thiouridylase